MSEQGKVPTLKDVARQAGVHPSTVSRCLDPGQAGRIGAPTRERVLEAARTLGYRPHPGASNLRRQRSRSVGLLIPELANPIYALIARGVSDRLAADGFTVLLFETRDDGERLTQLLAVFHEHRVEAVINAAAHSQDARRLREFIRSGVPVVLAARDLAGLAVTRVMVDDFRGAGLAAAHLLSLGHHRIAEIAGPDDVTSFVERSRGLRARLVEAGIDGPAVTVRTPAAMVPEGRRAAEELLAAGPPPTAVFAHNDLLAIGALAALAHAGLRCPEDVSVVGYNDTPLTEYLEPALSTVRLPALELGELAAERALAALGAPHSLATVSLQPTLVPRGSSGPPADRPTAKEGARR